MTDKIEAKAQQMAYDKWHLHRHEMNGYKFSWEDGGERFQEHWRKEAETAIKAPEKPAEQ